MKIFGKKRPADIVGADGVTYVHVPVEQTENYVGALNEKADDRLEDPIAGWVELAHRTSFQTVIDRMREAETRPTFEQARFVFTASKIGYFSRIVEFEDLDIEDRNDELTEVMVLTEGEVDGNGWYGTASAMALTLVKYSLTKGDDPEVASLLTPIGAGFDVHNRMCVRQLGRLLRTPEGVDFEPDGMTRPELANCWYYGYYLRAVEMSLPDHGRQSLSEVQPD